MSTLKLGIIGDGGTSRLWSTRFYYSPGAGYLQGSGYKLTDGTIANRNVSSSGPMQDAVASMVLGRNPRHILNLGDMVYNTGASTLYEENVGRQFNAFMAPYPSPLYVSADSAYRKEVGNKVWPFDTYDFPNGFPNPVTGRRGGSKDGKNRFWPTIGNHEYYLRTSSQGETNISLHTKDSAVPDVSIKGQSSTPAPQPFVDYFAWLNNPDLAKQAGLRVGSADRTGNSGVYYKVSLDADDLGLKRRSTNGRPLVDVFSLDTMRLIMNRGGKYPQFTDGYGPDVNAPLTETWNLEYDPTLEPNSDNGGITVAANSSDPYNGWKQFSWLRNELENSEARWKIIIGHQPIYGSGGSDGQLDDNVNNPDLQRLLNGLPKGSFDVYMNGHAHFYQRVLEGNGQGIGQGIPFIGLGSSGRMLDPANPIKIGQSTYFPTFEGDSSSNNDNFMGIGAKKLYGTAQDGVPYNVSGFYPYLLKSDPLSVAISAGQRVFDGKTATGWTSEYGFGFGGGLLKANKNSLLFKYQQPTIADPAIADNLDESRRLKVLNGWEGLRQSDWRPKDPVTGQATSSLAHTAMLRLTFEPADNGEVSAVSVYNQGFGYMAGVNGDHSVDFEIRGNDPITGTRMNPDDVAIIRLDFVDGSLSSASIVNDGSGYANLGQVMQSNTFRGYNTVPFAENQDALVPLNYSLVDTWYEAPNSNFKDSYLIAKTTARARVIDNQSGKVLEVRIVGKDQQTRSLLDQLSQPSNWTTGYSGSGEQRGYRRPQQGSITLKTEDGLEITEASLNNGVAYIPFQASFAKQPIEVLFGGDPTSSFLVNFKPSSTLIDI